MSQKGFQNGHKRFGGRKKGHITRDRQMLLDKCKELEVDVFEILLLFAKGDWKALGYSEPTFVTGKTQRGDDVIEERIPPELRQKSAKDAAQYVLPQLKAVDVGLTDSTKKAIDLTLNLTGSDGSPTQPPGPDEPSKETL